MLGGYSWTTFDDLRAYLLQQIAPQRVLDIGPGVGKYGRLVRQAGRLQLQAQGMRAPGHPRRQVRQQVECPRRVAVVERPFGGQQPRPLLGRTRQHAAAGKFERGVELFVAAGTVLQLVQAAGSKRSEAGGLCQPSAAARGDHRAQFVRAFGRRIALLFGLAAVVAQARARRRNGRVERVGQARASFIETVACFIHACG